MEPNQSYWFPFSFESSLMPINAANDKLFLSYYRFDIRHGSRWPGVITNEQLEGVKTEYQWHDPHVDFAKDSFGFS